MESFEPLLSWEVVMFAPPRAQRRDAELGKETEVTVEGLAGCWSVCVGRCGSGSSSRIFIAATLWLGSRTLSFSFQHTYRQAGARGRMTAGLTLYSRSPTRQY